jgi:c-di-GMP phosphodiesterase
MSENCLVRQPVFGTTGALLAYEIRFSDSDDGRRALVQSILNGTFDTIRGQKPAFVACSRAQLLENAYHMIDPTTVILLLPRTMHLEPEILEAITKHRDGGGHFALDEMNEAEAPSEALLAHVSWARVDVRVDDPAVIGRVCDRLAQGRKIKLIAHHIEDLSQYEASLELGVDGFQGSFFSSPEPVPAADLPQSTVAAMRLMGLARDPNVNDRKLEDVLATDPVLTVQLLRLVNSAAVGMRGVSSLGQALRLIGRNAFQRWLAVAVAASRKSQTGVDQELVRQAVERGRLLEQLGGRSRDPGTLFLVGLFSLLDAVFRMSLPEILERVALSDEANAALLDRTGPYADALAFAESYELGMFENASELAKEMGVDPASLGDLYTNALTWTAEALGTMLEAPAPPPRAGIGARR